MRLHSDVIHHGTVYDVMHTLRSTGKIKGVWADTHFRGSRSRKYGFDLWLTADERPGRRRKTNPGTSYPSREGAGVDVAATWDEWGIVLAALYEIDPSMTGDYYADAEHYHYATGGRFADGGPEQTHDHHQWEWGGNGATCKCGAKRPRAYFGKHDSADFESMFGRKWGERITAGASA